jgi:hypothetical protein
MFSLVFAALPTNPFRFISLCRIRTVALYSGMSQHGIAESKRQVVRFIVLALAFFLWFMQACLRIGMGEIYYRDFPSMYIPPSIHYGETLTSR